LLPGTNFVQGALPGQSSPTAAQIKFDPSTSLASRIAYPPEFVLQHYRDAPKPSPTFHELTEAEHAEVESVLQQLPAFSRKVFSQHVRSISFVDGPFGNGTTMMEDGSTLPVFDLVLRAGLLHENISELLTRKERNYYSIADSEITLSIEAGSLPAVLYILLHESVHVLDISNRAGKGGPPQLFANGPPGLLVQGIWEDARTPMPAYQSPLFKLSWFGSGKRASLDAAEPTYRMLAQTPFVSLYGSSNWYDDIAELVTCYDLTQRLHQPYRILLSRGHEVFYSLEPMNSPLVQGRFKTISTLFS
jgi:hypothetical protein